MMLCYRILLSSARCYAICQLGINRKNRMCPYFKLYKVRGNHGNLLLRRVNSK